MFGVVFLASVLLGDLFGTKLLSTVPSLYFLGPLILALLIDIEFSPPHFYADRPRLLISTAAISLGSMLALAAFFGMISFVATLIFLLEAAILISHFQVHFQVKFIRKFLCFVLACYGEL